MTTANPEEIPKDQIILALEDPLHFTIKHPLQHKWTLWFDDPAMAKGNPKATWEENLKKIATVDSVEDFWGVLNNLKKPSEITPGSNYHLFKDGVKPMWEEAENRSGGKWTYSQDRKKRNADLDRSWMHIMLSMIGQQFSNNENISGAVISVRKTADRIALWTKSYKDPKLTMLDGQEFKKVLGVGSAETVAFQTHSDSAVKSSSQPKGSPPGFPLMLQGHDAIEKCFKFGTKILNNYMALFYASIPLIFLMPRLYLTAVLVVLAFLLGFVAKEASIPTDGGFNLVKRHYEGKIVLLSNNQLPVPVSLQVDISVDLDKSLTKLVDFIVRDFIDGWYGNLNKSGSPEFSNSIHASLRDVLISVGRKSSATKPSYLLLAVMETVIAHVKEFREFDATGLDLADYLAIRPKNSRFKKIQTREDLIDRLRESSMKICFGFLPKADRNSPAVNSICREILATSVFLPLIEKISDSDWINLKLVSLLMKRETESGMDKTNGQWDRNSAIASLIAEKSMAIEEADLKLAEVAADEFELYVEEKLSCQAALEDLSEMQSVAKTFPTSISYLDLNCLSLEAVDIAKDESIMQGLGMGTTYFMFRVKYKDDEWTLLKLVADIENFWSELKKDVSRLRSVHPPSFYHYDASNARELHDWFKFLILKDDIAILSLPTQNFFKQESLLDKSETRLSGLWRAASSGDFGFSNAFGAANLAVTAPDATKPETEEPITKAEETDNDISHEDLEIILDITFTAVEELFALGEGDQWLRQQSLQMIKVILRRAFSRSLSEAITAKIRSVSSQKTAAKTLSALSDELWPEGRKWGQGPAPEVRTPHDIEHTRHILYSLLSDHQKFQKSEEFENVYSKIQTAVGQQNAQKGFVRGFHLLQNKQLLAGLCCEVLAVIADILTGEETDAAD